MLHLKVLLVSPLKIVLKVEMILCYCSSMVVNQLVQLYTHSDL